MSAATMPAVPPEISDYVLDFLHDDRKALAACSRAARALRPAARFHLFRTLNIFSLRSGQHFWQLLQRDPALGLHARHAVFAKLTSPTQPGRCDDGGAPPAGALWPSVFRALPAVERLEFLYVEMTDATFRQAITQHFAAVTHLALQYCRLPVFGDFVQLVNSFPALTDLTLLYIGWQDVETLLPRRPDTAARLRSLTLGRDLDLDTIADWLLAEDMCAGLTSLSVCPASLADVFVIGDIVRAAGPSLHDLSMDWYGVNYNDVGLPDGFSLAGCTSLRTLKLCVPVNMNGTASWVKTVLAQLVPTHLESIYFEIRLLGDLDAVDWRGIDRLLTQPSFAKLKSVHFRVKAWHTATLHGPGACTVLLERLATLHARGMVHTAT